MAFASTPRVVSGPPCPAPEQLFASGRAAKSPIASITSRALLRVCWEACRAKPSMSPPRQAQTVSGAVQNFRAGSRPTRHPAATPVCPDHREGALAFRKGVLCPTPGPTLRPTEFTDLAADAPPMQICTDASEGPLRRTVLINFRGSARTKRAITLADAPPPGEFIRGSRLPAYSPVLGEQAKLIKGRRRRKNPCQNQ